MLLSTAVSSLASEHTNSAPTLPLAANPAPLTAPTVLSQKVTLNSTDQAKYQRLAVQSQNLAARQTAGASSTTKTVLITIGAIVLLTALSGNFA